MTIQKEDQIEQRMKELRTAYAKELPALLNRVHGFYERVVASQAADREALSEVHRLAHSINGSGPSFGFHYLGELANELETTMDTLIKDPTAWSEALAVKAQRLIRDMKKAPMDPGAEAEKHMKGVPAKRTSEPETYQPVAWIGPDPKGSKQIRDWLQLFGIRSVFFSHPDAVLMKGKKFKCDALILDLSHPKGNLNTWEKGIANLKATFKRVPQIFLLPDKLEISEMIMAYEHGGDACFTMPIDFFSLVNKLDEVISHGKEGPYRLLIVDDDAVLAAHIASIMRKAGLEVAVLNDPLGIETILDAFDPELILMDLYLGSCSGNALAKLIRQKDAYKNIPIVYISTETELNKRLEAFEVGADDFLLKPVKYHYLYYTLYSRMKRSRLLDVNLNRDSLTGLLDQSAIRQKLADAINHATVSGEPFTFALIDLDDIGKVNAALGNQGGDLVLKTLAKLLDINVRGIGFAGRYGGKEFSLVLPGMNEEKARAFFEPLREGFADMIHGRDDSYPGLCVSFSAGLVSTASIESPAKMASFALRALRSAQMQGGNCLVFTEVAQRPAPVVKKEPIAPVVFEDDELIFFHEDEDETKTIMVESAELAKEHEVDIPKPLPAVPEPNLAEKIDETTIPEEAEPDQDAVKVKALQKPLTIVVVDDEKQILDWLKTKLMSLGYRVYGALSGDEGFNLIKKHQPDLLLTDLLLFPGIHGFELCKKVRRSPEFPRVGIVVMTAYYRDDRYRREATDAGADVFITKPLELPVVAEALEQAMNVGK